MESLNVMHSLKERTTHLAKCDPDYVPIISQIKESFSGERIYQSFGCCLLKELLSKCESEVFEENATTWVRMTLKVLNSQPSDELVGLCYENLCKLIQQSAQVDKLSRDISTQAIDPILTLLLGANLPVQVQTFNVVKICLQLYSNSCGRFYTSIYKTLVQNTMHADQNISSSAMQCFPFLPLCGSGGEKKLKHASNWNNLLKSLLATANHFLIQFMDAIAGTELSEEEANEEIKLIEFPIENELLSREQNLCNAVEKCLNVLRYMLSYSMKFVVDLPISMLVRLFCDTSNVVNVLVKSSLSENVINAMKASIIKSMIQLMCICFQQFGTILLPYYRLLAAVLIKQLSYLGEHPPIYACLSNLLRHSKHIPNNVQVLAETLQCVLKDIDITVSPQQPVLSKESKKKRKDTRSNQTQRFSADIDRQSKHTAHNNLLKTKNCTSALQLLKLIINVQGVYLSETNMKQIVSTVLNIFSRIYGKDGIYSYPYDSERNVLLLFEVLHTLLCLHHDKIQLPTGAFISIFRSGLKDKSFSVQNYCSTVMANLDVILHGTYPSFRLNPDGIVIQWEDEYSKNNKEPLQETRSVGSMTDLTPMQMTTSHSALDTAASDDNVVSNQTTESKNSSSTKIDSSSQTHDTSSLRDTIAKSPRRKSVERKSSPPPTHAMNSQSHNTANAREEITSPRCKSAERTNSPAPIDHASNLSLTEGNLLQSIHPRQRLSSPSGQFGRQRSCSLDDMENSNVQDVTSEETNLMQPLHGDATETDSVVLVDSDSDGSSVTEIIQQTRKRKRNVMNGTSLREDVTTGIEYVKKNASKQTKTIATYETDDEVESMLEAFVDSRADL